MSRREVSVSAGVAGARPGFSVIAAKLGFLVWVSAFVVLEWIRYGPYGPLGRLVGYETIIRAQKLLLEIFSAKTVFD